MNSDSVREAGKLITRIGFLLFGLLALVGGAHVVLEAPAVTQEMAGLLIILIGIVCLGFASVLDSIEGVAASLKPEVEHLDSEEESRATAEPMSQRDRILWIIVAIIVLGIVAVFTFY